MIEMFWLYPADDGKQEYSSVLLHHHTVAFIGYGECLYFTT